MDLQTRAETLAQMLEDRLGLRGSGLDAKLRAAGRRLPRHLRRELGYIAEAVSMEESPRLAPRIDWPRIETGYTLAKRYLEAIDPRERRKTLAVNWLAGNALNIVGVMALVAVVLRWRGLV